MAEETGVDADPEEPAASPVHQGVPSEDRDTGKLIHPIRTEPMRLNLCPVAVFYLGVVITFLCLLQKKVDCSIQKVKLIKT